jgi:8-oxo-dGTP pyrophosphatase MutT (NUDIX family)
MPGPEAPAVVRDAATVLLLRDDAAGLVVWMMRRLPTMAFAARAHVFAGGSVDAVDRATAADASRWAVPVEETARSMGCAPDRAAAVLAAAVRETDEECGVDLAGGPAIDPERLVPWAWWLTPHRFPRRYDTWFFAVDARGLGEPRHQALDEADDARWWRPAAALREAEAGRISLLPPTLDCVQRLARASTVAEALADVRWPLVQRAG